jgi:hypothetical protein
MKSPRIGLSMETNMAQQYQVRGRSTAIFTDDDGLTKIVYHHTPVVSFNADKVVLNTGGYHTSTTKTRMNQASHQFGLGYGVFQKDWAWFVTFKGETLPFDDTTMTLQR